MVAQLRRLAARLRAAVNRDAAERELAREVDAHLAILEEEYRRSGLAPSEARHAARRAMGGPERAKELHRDARSFAWIDEGRRDVTAVLRGFARNPGFAAVAIVTLGIGIGATTAIYSALDAALLRPLPFPAPERLVYVAGALVPIDTRGLRSSSGDPAEPPAKFTLDVTDLQAMRDVFSHSAAHATGAANLGSGTEPLRATVTFVTSEFFATLGRDAARGRVFNQEEMVATAPKTVVLSDAVWRVQFGADPAIVGRTIAIDAVPHEVIGVMPPDFRFPAQAQLWVPMPVPAPMSIMSAFRNFLPSVVVARLAPGITVEHARERLDVARRPYPRSTMRGLAPAELVAPLQHWLAGDRRTALAVLMGTAALLLLIACTNTAMILLSRAETRRREIATHLAIGATRMRLIRRLLAESLTIALAAGAIGVVIAWSSLSLLPALLPPALENLAPPRMDPRVFGFSFAVAAITGLGFGVWPALTAARLSFSEAIRATAERGTTASGRLNRALVVAQVALACVLTVGAALMLSSLRSLLATDLGMHIDPVAAARLNLPAAQYEDADARTRLVREVLDHLGAQPDVAATAAINTLPLAGEQWIALRIDREGEPGSGAMRYMAPYLVVSPGYFDTMGIRFHEGRDLDWTDTAAAPVAIVNRALARQVWPGEDPLGKRFVFGGGAPRTVVGVVDDARIAELTREPEPQVYLPIQEQPQSYLALVARSRDAGTVDALPGQIRAAVRAADPSLPLYAALPMESVVAGTIAPRRMQTLLVAGFGAIALGLAAIGVYGVLAYAVAQRTREIGVRMALGAHRQRIIAMVMRQGLVLVATGAVIGLAGAAAATRVLDGMLYGVASRDAATFSAGAFVIVMVGSVAALIPAWRAATADPLEALRTD